MNALTPFSREKGSPATGLAINRNPVRSRSLIRCALAATLMATAIGIFAQSTPASATLVTKWTFRLEEGFTAFTGTATGTSFDVTGSGHNTYLENNAIDALGGGTIGPFANAYETLSWGEPDNVQQSSLALDGTTMGMLMTDGAAVNTVMLTHNNQPVFSPFLSTATLTDALFLAPNMPFSGPEMQLPGLQFGIHFDETLNQAPCVVQDAGPACSDIFVVDIPIGFDPMDNSINQQFLLMDEWYNAKLQVTGLSVLTEAECMAAVGTSACVGFTTQENSQNTFQASLQITHVQHMVPVPEPGTLAMFGLGIAGLGFARRRKSRGTKSAIG